ncbi:MAG: septum formation initiator family protein [Planctomycetota bacterium]
MDGTTSKAGATQGASLLLLLCFVALSLFVHFFVALPAQDRLEAKHAQAADLSRKIEEQRETGRALSAVRDGLLGDPETREAELRRRGWGREGEIVFRPVRASGGTPAPR